MKTLFIQMIESDKSISSLVLRVPLGTILAAHGAQKLFGWFGGYGLTATGEWMASQGLEPGWLMALLAGSAEFFGGIALIAGLFTRPAAAVSAFTMLIALLSVHLGQGFFLETNGIEYALALFAATLSLSLQGGGRWSMDSVVLNLIRRDGVSGDFDTGAQPTRAIG